MRRGELEGEHGGASLATGDNLQADPPWLRGSSDCRVGQAPMQAVHGFPGASPFPILHSPTTSFASSTTADKFVRQTPS